MIKEKIVRKAVDREQYAKDLYCCYIVEQGMSVRDAAMEEGYKQSVFFLKLFAKHIPGYYEASVKRREESEHNKHEREKGKRSKQFRYEVDFSNHCIDIMKNRGVYCEENNTTRTGFEIDIETIDTCFELKITSRKKDLFTAIGQLLSNALLSGLKPVLLIPADIHLSKDMRVLYELHNIDIYSEKELIAYCEAWNNG